MATSKRGQKFGITIFDRVRGLLRGGGMSVENKPIWYEVYKKFPPQIPKYKKWYRVPRIIYPEDLLRRKFQSEFGHLMNKDPKKKDHSQSHIYVMDLTDHSQTKRKSIEQRFVEKYFELQKAGVPPDRIFNETCTFCQLDPSSEKGEELKEDKKPKLRVRDVELFLESVSDTYRKDN